MPRKESSPSPGLDTPTESHVAFPTNSEFLDLHKKLAAAKTKSARDNKRHQRAKKKAEELQVKLDTVLLENNALVQENQRLLQAGKAAQDKGCDMSSFGAAAQSNGDTELMVNRLMWPRRSPGRVREFVPAKGYETTDADATLVLTIGQNVPMRLSKQAVEGMTTLEMAQVLQGYGKAFSQGLELNCKDWSGRMAGIIQGLVNEATAFGSYVALNNPSLSASYTALAAGPGQGVDYEQIPGALRLTPEQQQRIVEMRATYLCTVALLANERSSIMANCQHSQERETCLEDALGLAMEQLSLKQGMEQLTHNLQRQNSYLCTFSEGVLREVLTPVQAAMLFVNACPWYPAVLALANVVAAQLGEQGPDELFGEASSIRLAPSVTAALRRQAEHINSTARAQGMSAPTFHPPPSVPQTKADRFPKPGEAADAPAWRVSQLVPRFSQEAHPGPPGPPAQAHSGLVLEHCSAPPSVRHAASVAGSDASDGGRRRTLHRRRVPGEPSSAAVAGPCSECGPGHGGGLNHSHLLKHSDSAPSRFEGPRYRGDPGSAPPRTLDVSALLGPQPGGPQVPYPASSEVLPSFSKAGHGGGLKPSDSASFSQASRDGAANAVWLMQGTPPQQQEHRSSSLHDAAAGPASEDGRTQSTPQSYSPYAPLAPQLSASQAFSHYATQATQQGASQQTAPQAFTQYAAQAAQQSASQAFTQFAMPSTLQSAASNGYYAMPMAPSKHPGSNSDLHGMPLPESAPPQAGSRSKNSAPELLSSTLSQLLETATQQYQTRMSEAADAPSTSPPAGGDFPMTWSSLDRSLFGSALPSTMSLGLPQGTVPYPGLGSPMPSIAVPDVATILSGLEGGARQHELSLHYGLDRKQSGPLTAFS